MTDQVEANRRPVVPGSRPPHELRRMVARSFWGASRRIWGARPARARGSGSMQAYGGSSWPIRRNGGAMQIVPIPTPTVLEPIESPVDAGRSGALTRCSVINRVQSGAIR
jgi:hypothetical protein